MFSGLSSLFFDDPYEGMDIYGPIKQDISPYFQPYQQAGEESLGSLQEQLGRMYQDPGALYSQLGAGYRESPGYQHQVQQATQAANRAAAAGGQLGSPAQQQALAGQISGMAGQDYQDYMNQMMGLYGQGVQGLQGLTGLGFQAGSGLAEDLAQAQMQQAGLQMAGKQAQMGGMSGLMGGLGSLAGGWLGGRK